MIFSLVPIRNAYPTIYIINKDDVFNIQKAGSLAKNQLNLTYFNKLKPDDTVHRKQARFRLLCNYILINILAVKIVISVNFGSFWGF